MWAVLCAFVSAAALIPLAVLAAFAWWARSSRFARRSMPQKCTVAFFHPYCNSGGGGERVLWCAIDHLLKFQDPSMYEFIIYSGDPDINREGMLDAARKRFGLALTDNTSNLRVVHIASRGLLEAARYPRFTMLGQSIGSMLVAWECLVRFNPDIWVDTTGYAFTLPVAKLLAACRVACYVHYPTITTDMLRRVHDRRPTYNNGSWISQSAGATYAKLLYYHIFAWLYGLAGGFADVIMVNSSWTKGHLDGLWALPVELAPLAGRAAGKPDDMTPSVLVAEAEEERRRLLRLAAGSASRGSAAEGDAALCDAEDDEAQRAYELDPLVSTFSPQTLRQRSVAATAAAAAAATLSPWGGVGAGSSDTPVTAAVQCAAVAVDGVFSNLARALGLPGVPRPAAHVVYPPCNTDALATLPLGQRDRVVVSVAQFRPEKAHALQLQAFAKFRLRGESQLECVECCSSELCHSAFLAAALCCHATESLTGFV
jgi:glycosyltransferase involved in cell wall biosynthesis